MLQKKKGKEVIQVVEIRIKMVEKYIHKVRPDLIATVVEIKDPYGPAIERQDASAIIVSP